MTRSRLEVIGQGMGNCSSFLGSVVVQVRSQQGSAFYFYFFFWFRTFPFVTCFFFFTPQRVTNNMESGRVVYATNIKDVDLAQETDASFDLSSPTYSCSSAP